MPLTREPPQFQSDVELNSKLPSEVPNCKMHRIRCIYLILEEMR